MDEKELEAIVQRAREHRDDAVVKNMLYALMRRDGIHPASVIPSWELPEEEDSDG